MHRLTPDKLRNSQTLGATLYLASALVPMPAHAYAQPTAIVESILEDLPSEQFDRRPWTEAEKRQLLYGTFDFSEPIVSILPDERSDLEKTLDFVRAHHEKIGPTHNFIFYAGPGIRDTTMEIYHNGTMYCRMTFDMNDAEKILPYLHKAKDATWKVVRTQLPALQKKKRDKVLSHLSGIDKTGFTEEEFGELPKRHPMLRGPRYISAEERGKKLLNANPGLAAFREYKGKS